MENDRKSSRGDEERYDLEILLRRPSLRTNISRRVSQACREAIPTEETTCGVGCLRGQWLQSFANRNSFIFIYGILGSFYGSYYAYFYGAITTLEKRFNFSSQTMGIIASVGDITQVITCIILFFCVPKIPRPRVIGVGILLVVASTIIFALPHFLTEPENILGISTRDYSNFYKNETDSRDCPEENHECSRNSEKNNGFIFLISAQILHGIGSSLYYVAGKTYKDDNVEKHQPPAILSLLTILTILGPAFGYWLSSMVLKIFEYPGLLPHINITEEEPQWLGAWWLGSLMIGFMLIVPGLLVTLFPANLPKAGRIHNQMKGVAEERGNTDVLRNIFINPAFSSTHFAAVFNIMGFMAYFIFFPKYVETQYRISASTANLTAGSITLISSAAGIIVTNSIITRYRPSARILASWTVIVGILSMGGLISYIYLGCPSSDDEITAMTTWNSNTSCKCPNSPFYPVCDEHSQSFTSPCHAGCGKIFYINYLQGYESCNYTQPSLKPRKVFTGFCLSNCHSEFFKFIIVTCSLTFLYATGRTSNYWFEANYKESQGKLLVLSPGLSFLGLLASIPAPIAFGYLLDNSCLLWERNCQTTGHCWLYDNEKLRLSMNLSAVGYAVIGLIYDLVVWYSVKNLELFDDVDYSTDESYEK